jgi:uroporphyrinogen-III synthase
VFPVTPYRYASDSETASVANAITKMASGEIDVIAVTSSPQIRRLLEVGG